MTQKAASLHIFKSGIHTTMDGRSLTFGEPDLAATVAAYNPALHEAPLVVGHPQHDLPAYGWVAGLEIRDGALHATPTQVDTAFAEMVNAGRFKKISAAFYAPDQHGNPTPGVYYLRHVGFLGAQPPAIKGLRSPSFAADAADCITLELDVSFSEAVFPPATTPPETSHVTDQELAQLRADAARAKQLEDDNAALTQRAETAEKAHAAQATAAVHASNTAFAEKLASEGRLISAEQPVVVALLNQLAPAAGGQAVEFGEGDDKKPLGDALRGFLEGLPPRLEFGEHAKRERAAVVGEADKSEAHKTHAGVAFGEGVDADRLEQHRKTLAYAKEHQVSYAAAARAVIK